MTVVVCICNLLTNSPSKKIHVMYVSKENVGENKADTKQKTNNFNNDPPFPPKKPLQKQKQQQKMDKGERLPNASNVKEKQTLSQQLN